MLHCRNRSCRYGLFTFSAPHKETVVGTKNFDHWRNFSDWWWWLPEHVMRYTFKGSIQKCHNKCIFTVNPATIWHFSFPYWTYSTTWKYMFFLFFSCLVWKDKKCNHNAEGWSYITLWEGPVKSGCLSNEAGQVETYDLITMKGWFTQIHLLLELWEALMRCY